MKMREMVYEVEIGSPPDYEELVAYLYFGDSLGKVVNNKIKKPNDFVRYEVAILTKEEGPDKVKIKFSEYATQHDLNVDELLQAITKAKDELLK